MKRQLILSPAGSGLTAAVNLLQDFMHERLPWMEKSFGLAYDGFRKNVAGLTLTIPEVHIRDTKEYREVLPDDKNLSQIFYYADGPESIKDAVPFDGYRMETPVSLVVWVNLERLKKAMGYDYDHRYTEELKDQLLRILNTYPDFVPRVVETRTKEVWKGWTVGDGIEYFGDQSELAETQLFKHPEAGFRVYGTLYYEHACR